MNQREGARREPTALGVVMAGGESRRFGSRKPLAPFLGEPLVRRAARVLEGQCPRVVVSTSDPEIGRASFLRELPDRVPGRGPLGGLHAALHLARDEGFDGAFLLACDMPLVTGRQVGEILGRVGELRAREGERLEGKGEPRERREREGDEGVLIAVPTVGPGRLEPLCGWYAIECLPVVEEALATGDLSLHALHERVGGVSVPIQELGPLGAGLESFRGANTPAELAELELLGRRIARPPLPPVVCVVGFKDTGKTGVAVGLAHELGRRGHRVAAVKHGHRFRLDTPGTDSWRLRREGEADPVVLAGPEGYAVMGSWRGEEEPGLEELVRRYAPEADVVVAEGFKRAMFPKIEVYRGGIHPRTVFQPDASDSDLFLALVTDRDLPGLPIPQFASSDPGLPEALADLVERRLMGAREA